MVFVIFQIVFQLLKVILERRNCALSDENGDMMFELITDYEVDYDNDAGPPNSRLTVNENDLRGIKLTPPPYLQRFGAVRSIIDPVNKHVNNHFRKVVEFGCADLKMISLLKHVENLEELIFVDNDREILEQSKWRIQPNDDDKFYYRKNPLDVKVYEGCCTEYDDVLKNADAVICLELIQTLSPDELDRTIKNIFENIQPEMVIFTTPNKDFNPLLDLTSNMRRHRTHTFEWTRKELRIWARKVARRYPNYMPFYYACGPADKSYMQKLGALTLICAFRRPTEFMEVKRPESNYNLVAEVEYPHLADPEILEQAISLIKQVKSDSCKQWEYSECNENEIPINEVFSELYYRTGYEKFLNVIRRDGWILDEMRHVIIRCPYYDFSNEKLDRYEE